VDFPRCFLDHRASVVGRELRLRRRRTVRLPVTARAAAVQLRLLGLLLIPLPVHRRPLTNDSATPASRVRAAAPARLNMAGRSFVVTTGSGGSPYTSGSSSSKKKAPAPPTPSSGSSPYNRASGTPA